MEAGTVSELKAISQPMDVDMAKAIVVPDAVRSAPKYIVAQTGARRGYAVPAIIEQVGMLERFYTDVCGNVGWGRWLAAGKGLPWIGQRLQKLASRRVPEEIRSKTRTFLRPNLSWALRQAVSKKDAETKFRLDVGRVLELGQAAVHEGFGAATHVYAMLSEFAPVMITGKERGLTVVAEIYILLSTDRILEEERMRFPGWEPEPPDWQAISQEIIREDVLFTRVDHYVCPSDAVRDDLIQHWGVAPEKAVVVPYGMSPSWLDIKPQPVRGRILFVGTADLRKGIHYLARAAEILKERGRDYEFRVAGHVSEVIRARSECRHLNFLGRVPRDRISEEFQQADVFTLPTLAEGSAEVTYEALAAAVPLITTPAAGSVARDGIEGRIIPARDPIALADALETVIEDRELRNRMALAARDRARDYTWARYGDRLVAALTTIDGSAER